MTSRVCAVPSQLRPRARRRSGRLRRLRIRFGALGLAARRLTIGRARRGRRSYAYALAPDRLVLAVAPIARPIKCVDAEFEQASHFVHPARMHPIGVVVGGMADFGEPDFAIERVFGDYFGLLPHIGLVDAAQILALTSKGELAGEMAVRVLINDAADVMRIVA